MTRRIALTSRFGWRLLILGAVGVLVFGAGDAAISAPREGVDCGCEEVGLYKNPEPGEVPAKKIISDSEGTSPDGTYLYTVDKQGNQIFLTVTDANSNVLVNEMFTPAGNAEWGFSPDEHRFVYHFLDNMSHHYVKLFDLEQNGAAINPNGYEYTTGDSELRFSPKGHYFFYAAKLSPQNDEVFVSIVDVAHPPYKIYYDTFDIVMEPAGAGLAAWGFSKTTDGGFMYAYNTISTNVRWRLIDLTNMVVFDEGEDDTQAGTWWGFSPCGDVFGIIEHNIGRIRLIATLDGTLLYDEGEIGNQLSCSLAEHLLNGESLSPLLSNTADQGCPSAVDTEPPEWPAGAKLSAPNVTFAEVTLNWPAANDNVEVTQYAIYKDGVSVATVGGGENTYKVTELTSGTEYTFAVKAGDAAGNRSEELTTTVTTKSMSDVSVTKIDDHDPVAVGDVIVYTVTVTNNGPDATSNVSMVDTLPGDVNFVSAVSTKGVCTKSSGKLTCNIGDLGKNESATITIKMQTTERTLNGWSERELFNTARVTHSVADSNVANNVASEGTTVKKPMVSVLITDWPSPVKVGYYLVYNVKVINDGPFDVTNVNLKDVLASNVEFVSVTSQRCSCSRSGAEVTCNIGQMDVNDSVAVSILVKTKEPGIITNTYTATFKDKYSVDYEVSETVETMATLWNPDFVDSGECGALAVDSLGYIHIVYVKEMSSEGPSLIMYSNNIGGAWVRQLRQQINRGALFTGLGLAIDSDDKVHICYAQMECNEVSYECTCFVKYTNNVAESWAVPLTIFEAPVTSVDGGFISVGIDRNSKVHVGLKPNMWEDPLLYLTNTSGTWVQKELDQRAYNGASMVVDHNDREHFAFYSWNIIPDDPNIRQGPGYITNAPDGLWQQPEALEEEWRGGEMEGLILDIAVDSSNRPHISYVGSADQFADYKYAVRQSDGSWDVALVGEGGVTGGGNCIAVDSSDKVHICYHHNTGCGMGCEELRCANNTSGSWVKESIDYGWRIRVGKDGIGVYGDVTHLCFEHKGNVIYANNIETGPDGDWDGMDDTEEQGPDGNDTEYDGNKDDVPDSQQVNVASLKSSKGDGYITIASGDGTILAGVEGVENPSPSEPPSGADFPFGFFRFTIYGVEMGGAVIVKLYLPEGPAPSTYYKYGATSNDANEHWYEFLYDGQTGAEIANNIITLHLVDGGRGDGDLTANAIIVEPGGPGWPGGPEKCIVDFDDLQRFCQQWLMTGVGVAGDLDKNKKVDFADYSIFDEQWLNECPFGWPLKWEE